MVRTKADAGIKVGAKASRKSVATPSRNSSFSKSSEAKGTPIGGNAYQPRETPNWQKPITSFFGSKSETYQAAISQAASSSGVQEQDSEAA